MKKVYLIDRNDETNKRDITELADSWYTVSNGYDVRVNYHHIMVNGQRVPEKCQRLHMNSYVSVEEQ